MKHCNIRLADKGLKANYLVNQLDFILHLQEVMSDIYHNTALCMIAVAELFASGKILILSLQMKGGLCNRFVFLSVPPPVSLFPSKNL